MLHRSSPRCFVAAKMGIGFRECLGVYRGLGGLGFRGLGFRGSGDRWQGSGFILGSRI